MNKAARISKWVLVCAVFVLLFGYITMALWNWLIPSIFNLRSITFWESLGLLLLFKILFGSWGRGGWGKHTNGSLHWKHRYQQKLSELSPEDRERFKARMWEKWCPQKKTSDGRQGTSNV